MEAERMFENDPKPNLRVLQIISGVGMGGIENQTLLFLQHYDQQRFTVDICCTGSTKGPLRDRFLATNSRLLLCRWSKNWLAFVWCLARLLRKGGYDVVHARTVEVSGAAMLAARITGVKGRIASYHHTKNWDNMSLARRLTFTLLQRLTRRWATKILGISAAVLDTYFDDWRQHPERFEVCYNGIDLDRFSVLLDRAEVRGELGIPIGAMVMGNVGGFRKVKNHQVFVDVAERVSKRHQDVYFLLVGDGYLRTEVETQVERLGLKSRFVFAGIRHDIPRILAAMDIVLMPSIHEGFGTVVVEAQAAGVPVIASDLLGIREALCPEMAELCHDPHDADGMADEIVALLKAPHKMSELGQIGTKYAKKHFSIQRAVEQLQRVYTEEVIVSNR